MMIRKALSIFFVDTKFLVMHGNYEIKMKSIRLDLISGINKQNIDLGLNYIQG